jgi:hypothetical protein
MIGHQTISPDLRIGAARRRRDQTAVEPIILGSEEHRLAAIAALGDMMRQARHNHARNPRHAVASNSQLSPIVGQRSDLVNCQCARKLARSSRWKPGPGKG